MKTNAHAVPRIDVLAPGEMGAPLSSSAIAPPPSSSAIAPPLSSDAIGGGSEGRSLIAGANAWFRASESERPGDPILEDPLAASLAERDVRVQAIRYARFALPPLYRAIEELKTAHCVRHRAIDELVLRAVEADGFRQVVVVGAGYDTRPTRFSSRLEGVRWIELDHPATQARKRARVEHFEGVRDVEMLPVDLSVTSLTDALAESSLDRAEPVVFVLEGLIHYLTHARLEALLGALAQAGPRVRVVFSYIRSEMYHARTTSFGRLVLMVREIPQLHFTLEEMAARCSRHRLGQFQNWNFSEQVRDFAPQAEGRPARLSQDVATVDLGA